MSEIFGLIILLILIIFFVYIAEKSSKNKTPKYTGTKINCPRCGSTHFHAFVEEQVVSPAKVKSKTTLNMNPLKPFTVFNHKEKVVRQQVTRQVSKFVCDDCGCIFE